MTLLYFVPATWSAGVAYFDPKWSDPHAPWLSELSRAILELSRFVPAIFIVWGSGDPMRIFGIQKFVWWRALPLVLGAILFYFTLRSNVDHIFSLMWFDEWRHSGAVARHNLHRPPQDLGSLALLLAVLVISVSMEEFIARGYLIARLTELTGRFWVAATISSVMFAGYHIYEGMPMLPIAFGIGMFFSLMLRVTKSIWPGLIAHYVIDAAIFLMFAFR